MNRLATIALVAVGTISVTAGGQELPPRSAQGPPVTVAPLRQPFESGSTNGVASLPGVQPVPHEAGGLTLSDLEQMALQTNPTLSQARAEVQAARGIWQQVGLYPNPVAGCVGEEMGDEGTAGKQGGFIGQEVVTGGKLQLNRQVACQEVVRLEQELAAQQFRVLTDVRTTFYDVLVAQRTVELTDRLVRIADIENAVVQCRS